jgi:hypothetical protein
MTRIAVLGGQADKAGFVKKVYAAIEGWTGPQLYATHYYMHIDGEPVIVCTLAGWGGCWTALKETLVKSVLRFEGAEAAVIIEFDDDVVRDASCQALNDHRAKGVVE